MGIKIRNVYKKFHSGTEKECVILKNMSFDIHQGEMVAIQGRSGAGKSTLLHIIGCLDKATSGQYILDEKDISACTNKKIAKIRNQKFGFVMQDFGLINEDTVYHNVSVPLLLGNCKLKDISKKVEEKLQMLGISGLKNRKVESLSGGEKQRVAIARALVNDPEYILADEPTGSLDSNTAERIMKILSKLHAQGKTVIIITHDDLVAKKCQRIIQISDGTIVGLEGKII